MLQSFFIVFCVARLAGAAGCLSVVGTTGVYFSAIVAPQPETLNLNPKRV